MTEAIRTWQGVMEEVRRRIHARDWPPGALIPNEADLAAEFGVARVTVNRALRTLAEAGLLDRRRKAEQRANLQRHAHQQERCCASGEFNRLVQRMLHQAIKPCPSSGNLRLQAA